MTEFKIRYFHGLGNVEGVSLLILLFVAMPVRHFTQDPEFVRQMGMIHGILFLMYAYTAIDIAIENKWQKRKLATALILASVPFGSFFFSRQLKKTSF